jgi:uncharacterized protein (DUF2384 family)
MNEATAAVLEDGHVRVRVGTVEGIFAVRENRLVPISEERVFRDIQQVRDHLLEIMKPDAVERWIYAPNPALGEISPREAIEAGKTELVLELIAQVAHGIHT